MTKSCHGFKAASQQNRIAARFFRAAAIRRRGGSAMKMFARAIFPCAVASEEADSYRSEP
jgi:hypothetical protein